MTGELIIREDIYYDERQKGKNVQVNKNKHFNWQQQIKSLILTI